MNAFFGTLNIEQICHIGLLFIIWLIISPVMISWTYKIFLKRHSIILQKRYIGLTIVSCILCISWICIGLPLYIWQNWFTHTISFGVAISILYPILNHGILYTQFVRFFMLYFLYNWTDITLSSHWIIHIRKPSSKDRAREKKLLQQLQKQKPSKIHTDNENKEDINSNNNPSSMNFLTPYNKPIHTIGISGDKAIAMHRRIKFPSQVVESWFIKNRPKYSSVRRILGKLYGMYLLGIGLVMFVSIMTAFHPTHKFWNSFEGVIRLLVLVVPCVAIRYLWIKTPKYVYDSFFFRDEMRKLMNVIIITCCLYSLLILLTAFNGVFIEDNKLDEFIKILNETYVIFTCLSTVYYQTQWLMNSISSREKILDCKFYNTPNEELLYNSRLSPQVMFGMKAQIEMSKITENVPTSAVILSKESNITSDNYEFEIKQPESQASNQTGIQYKELEPEEDEYNTAEYHILFNALQQNTLFHDFTIHLASELSMELSFAFIEFTQFRRLIERYSYHENYVPAFSILNSDNTTEPISYSFVGIQLPKYISRSSIVHNKKYARMQIKYRFRKIARKLTEKYLYPESEFELPINKMRKREVTEWVKLNCKYLRSSTVSSPRPDTDHSFHTSHSSQSEGFHMSCLSKTNVSDQLYDLFEDCRKEIYFLMAHSVDRFVKLEAYKNGDKVMSHNNLISPQYNKTVVQKLYERVSRLADFKNSATEIQFGDNHLQNIDKKTNVVKL